MAPATGASPRSAWPPDGRAALHRYPHLRAAAARDRDRRGGRGGGGRPRSTRPRATAPAPASGRRASARAPRCCGPTTRRWGSRCGARRRWWTGATSGSPPGTPSARFSRSPPRSSRCSRPTSCRSSSAATTWWHSASFAPTPRCTGRSALVLLDAHADTWDAYYGERFFHGTPFRRAVEEGAAAAGALAARRHARAALLRGGPRGRARDGLRADHRRRAARDAARRIRRARAHARGRRAGVPQLRHRRDRPGVRAGHRHTRGRGAAAPRGARPAALARGHALRRLRPGRGLAALRRARARPPRCWRPTSRTSCWL